MRDEVWDRVAQSMEYDNIKHLLAHLYTAQGKSARDISKVIGCSEATALRLIRIHEILPHESGPDAEIIPRRELEILSLAELERRYGVSRSAIWRIRQKLGIKRLNRRERKEAKGT